MVSTIREPVVNISKDSVQWPHSTNQGTNLMKTCQGEQPNEFLSSALSTISFHLTNAYFKIPLGTSLVAQWLRICLSMQGTWVQSLVWEDPTCRRATKPKRHNYWASALEPASHNYWAHVPQLLKPARLEHLQQEKPLQWEACALQRRVAPARHN